MPSNEKIYEVFKKTLFKGLEKVDISQIDLRHSVYEAALRSLENVQSKNANLTEVIKTEQRKILLELIHEIETKIENLKNEENSLALAVVPATDVNDTDFLLDDELNTTTSVNSFFGKIKSEISLFKLFGKKFIFSTLFTLIALLTISAYFGAIKESDNTANQLSLPYVINADQALLDFGRLSGGGSIKLADEISDGIIYEVDISDEEVKNRLDFVLSGDLAKQILAHDEPILVTIHVQKVSKEDIEFSLLFRGIGKSSRNIVKIVDQKTNEFFVITDIESNENKRSNVLIRLEISPTSEKFEEKPVLLLKKVVFSKI